MVSAILADLPLRERLDLSSAFFVVDILAVALMAAPRLPKAEWITSKGGSAFGSIGDSSSFSSSSSLTGVSSMTSDFFLLLLLGRPFFLEDLPGEEADSFAGDLELSSMTGDGSICSGLETPLACASWP